MVIKIIVRIDEGAKVKNKVYGYQGRKKFIYFGKDNYVTSIYWLLTSNCKLLC